MEQEKPADNITLRQTHAELVVLRALVEAALVNMEEDTLIDVVISFKQSCQRLQAETLAQPLSDQMLQEIDRAIAGHQHRLVMGGIAAPGLFDEG